MAARRCSDCGINYPAVTDYIKCPVCGGKTDQVTNAKPLPKAELAAVVFEAYYQRRGPREPDMDDRTADLFRRSDEQAALESIPVMDEDPS